MYNFIDEEIIIHPNNIKPNKGNNYRVQMRIMKIFNSYSLIGTSFKT